MSAPETAPTNGDLGWLSQAEVMRRLQVSRTSLYRWRRLYGLKVAVVGRRVFFSAASINELMERFAEGGPKAA